MIDAAQAVLLIVIVVLTTLLLVLGIQVFYILRDLRNTISKANKILDNTSQITESVSGPISSISSLVMGLKTGQAISSIFKKIHKEEEESVRQAQDKDDGK
ncbi:MAG: hypothetical protein HYT09_01750 [Candidatus Levybacteria bacterium]|nr:hypothetical protein [Candidatus Levybacteria bacterium]MBI4098397.1 hypothetical protein [Candidatus Levybacteria bacterium]